MLLLINSIINNRHELRDVLIKELDYRKNIMYYEKQVYISHLNRTLVGTLVEPDLSVEESGAVLFLHGWAADRHEIGKMYSTLAYYLAQEGITSLRFDFFGCGESSPEQLVNLTIESMLQDAKIALAFLQKNVKKINTPIGLCGFSLGAAIMSLLMHDYYLDTKKNIITVVGLSPIINLTNDLSYRHKKMLTMMLKKPLSDNNPMEYDLGWKKIPIRPNFVRQFNKFDPIISHGWEHYHGSCFVIGGELDFSGENVKKFSHVAKNAKLLHQEFLPMTDHTFNIFNNSNDKLSSVIKKTVNWFVKTLSGE